MLSLMYLTKLRMLGVLTFPHPEPPTFVAMEERLETDERYTAILPGKYHPELEVEIDGLCVILDYDFKEARYRFKKTLR